MPVFRVERTKDFTVMSNHHLRNRTLSLKAKGLPSLMLSLPPDWDYSLTGLAHICKDGMCSIRGTIAELEEHGYLRRRRLRNEKGQLTDIEYTILEQPESPPIADQNSSSQPKCENRIQAPPPKCGFQTLESPALDSHVLGKPALENYTQLNTHPFSIQEFSIHGSSIHPINHAGDTDWMDGRIGDYRELIRENIEYDILVRRYDRERFDEIVELMLEVVISKRKTIRVAGDDFPGEIVKSRMLKIDSSHVEYVFESMSRNATKVRNIKAYLLAALWSAPTTIHHNYQAEVNHDLHGGGAI